MGEGKGRGSCLGIDAAADLERSAHALLAGLLGRLLVEVRLESVAETVRAKTVNSGGGSVAGSVGRMGR